MNSSQLMITYRKFDSTHTHINPLNPELNLSRRAATGRSPAEIVGSNPTGGMDICLL